MQPDPTPRTDDDVPGSWIRDPSDPGLAAVLPWMFARPPGGDAADPAAADTAAAGAPLAADLADGWVVIARARSQLEAQMIAATLRDAEIDARCDEPMLVPLDDALRQRRTPVPVRVPARQQRAAQAALRRHVEQASALDWSEVDVGARTDSIVGRRTGGVPAPAMAVAVVALVGLVAMAVLALAALVI